MQYPTSRFRRKQQAFSLMEMSIVVLIIGIMIASIIPIFTQQALQAKQAEQVANMQAIEDALLAFRIKNNRLPCPAQANLANSAANFGVEAATPGTCTGGTLAAIAVGADNVVGAVPVRTLGLDEHIAYDPWGQAYTYMVDERITATGAYNTYAIDDATIGNITIRARDVVTNPPPTALDAASDLTTSAIAVVLAHGRNGHGAYLKSGFRQDTDSTNVDELENCNCDSDLVNLDVDAIFNTTLSNVNKTLSTDGFDDVLRYYTRGSFLTSSDLE